MKVAFCMPVHSGLNHRFALGAFDLVIEAAKAGTDIKPFMASSSDIAFNRNSLVKAGLEWGADLFLFADVDHVLAPAALPRLASLDKEVVGINYLRRGETDTLPTAVRRLGEEIEPVWTTRAKAEAGEVERVDEMGMGFCLVRRGVFLKLRDRALAAGRESVWPIFSFEPQEGGLHSLGEDTTFCRKCAAAGIELYVDHLTSFRSAHIAERPLTFT